MNRFFMATMALASSIFLAAPTQAATVSLLASDGTASVIGADLNGDVSDGLEGLEVLFSGLIDAVDNAPGTDPTGSTFAYSVIIDSTTLTILSGTFAISGYLTGNVVGGAVDLTSDPTTPALVFGSTTHQALSFAPSLIAGDFSIGLTVPTTDLPTILSVGDAIAQSPYAAASALVFEVPEVPLPAGALLLIGGLVALRGKAGFHRSKMAKR